jgi:hypothetical protein
MTHIAIHHYVLQILGLTISRLEKHQNLGLEIIMFKALKPYGPRLLKTYCPRTQRLKVWRPMPQGLGLGLLTRRNNLFVWGFNLGHMNHSRTSKTGMTLFVFCTYHPRDS